MPIPAMRTRRQADDSGSRNKRAGRTDDRVLENRAVADWDFDHRCCVQIDVRLRLAAFDMLAPAVDVFAERPLQPEMPEVAADPVG